MVTKTSLPCTIAECYAAALTMWVEATQRGMGVRMEAKMVRRGAVRCMNRVLTTLWSRAWARGARPVTWHGAMNIHAAQVEPCRPAEWVSAVGVGGQGDAALQHAIVVNPLTAAMKSGYWATQKQAASDIVEAFVQLKRQFEQRQPNERDDAFVVDPASNDTGMGGRGRPVSLGIVESSMEHTRLLARAFHERGMNDPFSVRMAFDTTQYESWTDARKRWLERVFVDHGVVNGEAMVDQWCARAAAKGHDPSAKGWISTFCNGILNEAVRDAWEAMKQVEDQRRTLKREWAATVSGAVTSFGEGRSGDNEKNVPGKEDDACPDDSGTFIDKEMTRCIVGERDRMKHLAGLASEVGYADRAFLNGAVDVKSEVMTSENMLAMYAAMDVDKEWNVKKVMERRRKYKNRQGRLARLSQAAHDSSTEDDDGTGTLLAALEDIDDGSEEEDIVLRDLSFDNNALGLEDDDEGSYFSAVSAFCPPSGVSLSNAVAMEPWTGAGEDDTAGGHTLEGAAVTHALADIGRHCVYLLSERDGVWKLADIVGTIGVPGDRTGPAWQCLLEAPRIVASQSGKLTVENTISCDVYELDCERMHIERLNSDSVSAPAGGGYAVQDAETNQGFHVMDTSSIANHLQGKNEHSHVYLPSLFHGINFSEDCAAVERSASTRPSKARTRWDVAHLRGTHHDAQRATLTDACPGDDQYKMPNMLTRLTPVRIRSPCVTLKLKPVVYELDDAGVLRRMAPERAGNVSLRFVAADEHGPLCCPDRYPTVLAQGRVIGHSEKFNRDMELASFSDYVGWNNDMERDAERLAQAERDLGSARPQPGQAGLLRLDVSPGRGRVTMSIDAVYIGPPHHLASLSHARMVLVLDIDSSGVAAWYEQQKQDARRRFDDTETPDTVLDTALHAVDVRGAQPREQVDVHVPVILSTSVPPQ